MRRVGEAAIRQSFDRARKIFISVFPIPTLAALLLLASCGGGGSSDSPTPATPPPTTTVNVNIANPTLSIANNSPVSPGAGMTLVWSDEFDDARLDPETWYFETGDGSQYGIQGWGNNELEWYQPDNAELDNGVLRLTARRESSNGYGYTSARISTRDRFAFKHGRIEARIKLPGGQGLWPAFWLLPQDSVYGTWAASGEIDVMEAVNLGGSGGNTVHGTLHYGDQWPNNTYSGGPYVVPADASENFHTYALEWDESEMRWYVDDVMYLMQNDWYTASVNFPAPFDQTFHILFNVAVGGDWPGSPGGGTVFPVSMEVDYVRVYSGN